MVSWIIKTHKPVAMFDKPTVMFNTTNVTFSRTEFLTADEAVRAIRNFDPAAIFVESGVSDVTNKSIVVYVGCKATYILEKHTDGAF